MPHHSDGDDLRSACLDGDSYRPQVRRGRITDELGLTAYHEAGHAAMALWKGVPFTAMSVIGDERSDGRVVPQICNWFRPDAHWDERFLPYIEVEIHVLLAGGEAERRVRGSYNDFGAATDFEHVMTLAARVHYRESALNAFVRWLNESVKETNSNDDYWGLVETLAESLLVKRELTYRQARRLAGPLASRIRWSNNRRR